MFIGIRHILGTMTLLQLGFIHRAVGRRLREPTPINLTNIHLQNHPRTPPATTIDLRIDPHTNHKEGIPIRNMVSGVPVGADRIVSVMVVVCVIAHPKVVATLNVDF